MNLIQPEWPREQFQLDNYGGVCVFSPLHAEERRMWCVEKGGLNQKNGEKNGENEAVVQSALQTDTANQEEES